MSGDEYDSDAEDSDREMLVSRYPGSNGILYRGSNSIIYISSRNKISVLGYDSKNVGIILPLNSDTRSLVEERVKIDDSLARECKHTGGLFASCFQKVGGDVIYVPINPLLVTVTPKIDYQPISLFKRVLGYIISEHQEVKFDLEVLPLKLKNYINFSSKLSDKRDELSDIELYNDALMAKFETSYLDKMAERTRAHQERIFMLNNDFSIGAMKLGDEHCLAAKELAKAANDKKTKILSEIGKLETLILKSS